MKKEFIDAIFDGEIVKQQVFITEKGAYQLFMVRRENDIYFYKYLNGKMTECCNLSKAKGRKISQEDI